MREGAEGIRATMLNKEPDENGTESGGVSYRSVRHVMTQTFADSAQKTSPALSPWA
jgi:hypothetical protein